jgi:site-specific DNA-methyltransferase (adenine-specific)
MGRLHYGDNLTVLREHVPSASVDLIYLDPPFNSNATYNILFRAPDGHGADASIEAFDDTWSWGPAASAALLDIAETGNHALHTLMQALRSALGENAMMAYLAMMAVRLVELHRVLKPGGSLYLHCDPTASHYLKLVLDAVFGPDCFRREIIWRSGWVSGFKTRTQNWVRNHDTIFYYVRDPAAAWTFNKIYVPHGQDYARRGGGANPQGKAIDDVWDDPALYSPSIKSFSTEKLGYPTQKPVALLERIIAASSNPGDVVLDPFCGCGTAVDAAQKLGRDWIGIDITHLAVGLIEKRMREGYPAIRFETIGCPSDRASAERLAHDDPHQFQQWITLRLGGYPWRGGRKGGDRGVDGYFYYVGTGGATETGVISVKAGGHVNPAMVRDLGRVMARDDHRLGLLLCAVAPTRGMVEEANSHGLIETEFGRFPALQIFTLADLFADRHPRLPPLVSPNRRASRVETRVSHQPGAQDALF